MVADGRGAFFCWFRFGASLTFETSSEESLKGESSNDFNRDELDDRRVRLVVTWVTDDSALSLAVAQLFVALDVAFSVTSNSNKSRFDNDFSK